MKTFLLTLAAVLLIGVPLLVNNTRAQTTTPQFAVGSDVLDARDLEISTNKQTLHALDSAVVSAADAWAGPFVTGSDDAARTTLTLKLLNAINQRKLFCKQKANACKS